MNNVKTPLNAPRTTNSPIYDLKAVQGKESGILGVKQALFSLYPNLKQPFNNIVIIGGGLSIFHGIDLGLKEQIKNTFTIVCNYAFKHFEHHILAFVDRDFYKPRPNKNNPDIYNELKQEKLIVGINDNGVDEFKLPNTLLLNKKYCQPLVGAFALWLANQLLDKGNIILCGFDWTKQPIPKDKTKYNSISTIDIHYYKKEINHRGIGYTGYYDNHNPDNLFNKIQIKKDIKIYNVSLQSNINGFSKISYPEMFKLLRCK